MDMPAPKGSSVPRPLQWGLLFYEALRLGVFTRIAARAGGEDSTALIAGTGNALFFLMALFLLVNFRRYAAYLPLYTAGKVLMVLVAAGCVVWGYQRIIRTVLLGDLSFLHTAGALAGIALGDAVSAGAGLFLLRRTKGAEGSPEAGGGNREAGGPGEPGAAGEDGGL